MYTAENARKALSKFASCERAAVLQGFFKTGPGEYGEGDAQEQRRVFNFYSCTLRHVNNWDLVDLSAPNIFGAYLYHQGSTRPFFKLARSPLLWKRRIAVVGSHYFIRQGVFGPTLKLCRMLLDDSHDLMHKACGWMLREVGKRNAAVLEGFLRVHAAEMPRTMLRYAIERLPAERRRRFLNAKAAFPNSF